MPFSRYVELGRVALINYGPDQGKLVAIVDVIDQNRALIDAPDMVRRQENFKRLALTDITITVNRLAKKKDLTKAFKDADVAGKFKASAWGKKIQQRAAKAAQNDFDRFKAVVARVKKSRAVKKALAAKK